MYAGQKWYDAWIKRMKATPEYADIVETNSAKAMDTTKLKYYTTKNINKWYDEAIDVICDQWKIGERTNGDDPDGAEIRWTGDKTRILFSDESAFKDRKEATRIAPNLLFVFLNQTCNCTLSHQSNTSRFE